MVELLTAMVILGTVLAAIVAAFAAAMTSEADQARREHAYANARLALQRMRLDIHCAGGVTSVDQNAYGGFTLTLTESNDQSPGGWCPGVIPAGNPSSGVQWCTVQHPSSTARFVLYRFVGLNPSDCGTGTGSTFQVDYVAAQPAGWPTNSSTTIPPTSWVGNIWPSATTCAAASAPTVAVDINVALDPVKYPKQNYELRDQIALRNANRC